MWSLRQVRHLPPVWDLLLPWHRHQIEGVSDRRDQRLLVSHPKDTDIHNLWNRTRAAGVQSERPTTGLTAPQCIIGPINNIMSVLICLWSGICSRFTLASFWTRYLVSCDK